MEMEREEKETAPLTYRIIKQASIASKGCTYNVSPGLTITPTTPWISDLRHDYPMEVGVEFQGSSAYLSDLVITCHEALTPSRIELYVGTPASSSAESASMSMSMSMEGVLPEDTGSYYEEAVFERLGYVKFRGCASGGNGFERETKAINGINLNCRYVKLLIHEPLMSDAETRRKNEHHQVALMGLTFVGFDASSKYEFGTSSLSHGLAPENCNLLVAEAIMRQAAAEGTEGEKETLIGECFKFTETEQVREHP